MTETVSIGHKETSDVSKAVSTPDIASRFIHEATRDSSRRGSA